jgi:hypothetical protein
VPFGSQISNQPSPFIERYISASWSGVQIVQNQNWRPGLGGMTMPFTGDIFVDLWVQTDYIAGATYLASSVWPATPIGPTNYYAGKVSQWDNYGGTFPVPFFGRWANLAVRTYFDLTIEIRCDVSNGTMNIAGVQGFMRAQAT